MEDPAGLVEEWDVNQKVAELTDLFNDLMPATVPFWRKKPKKPTIQMGGEPMTKKKEFSIEDLLYKPETYILGDFDKALELGEDQLDSIIKGVESLPSNQIYSRRREQLFQDYRFSQQNLITSRRKFYQQRYRFKKEESKVEGEFILKGNTKNEILSIKIGDLDKLRPESDLNDTIIDNYMKIIQNAIMSPENEKKVHIFSSFFMGRLLGDLKDDMGSQKQTKMWINSFASRVKDNYPSMKKWTRRVDIFTKKYLVIPINTNKHWNCMIIVNSDCLITQTSKCRIIFLDSLQEARKIYSVAIKAYLSEELFDRKQIIDDLEQVKTYQFLVPRQTNAHDCGLYIMYYIEYFLTHPELLQANLEITSNREHLKIFPRSAVYSMRELLRKLFVDLMLEANKELAVVKYLQTREQIIKESLEIDFDGINKEQFERFRKLNEVKLKKMSSEEEFSLKLRFHLDYQMNFYEKDYLLNFNRQ